MTGFLDVPMEFELYRGVRYDCALALFVKRT